MKVTVALEQYATLSSTKMYPHTKFGTPTSKNIIYAPDMIFSRTEARGQG